MGTRQSGPPASHRSARLLTAVYAAATLVALVLTLVARRRPGPVAGEDVFGLLNVPVARTFVSVVVLALITRALLGRKRIGLWLVALFQVLGLYVGVVALVPAARLPLVRMWESRGDLGRGLDIASMVVAVAALWWLHRIREAFTGRLQRGSWWVALAALAVGSAVTLGLAWALLGAVGAPRSEVDAIVSTVLAAFGGVTRRALVGVPEWVVEAVAACAGLTILTTVTLFLASARPGSRWSPDREVALRRLLARHGSGDSLGYFATRRDKASVFSPDGRAAVTYRVLAGVSLASSDPVGDPDSWRAAIEAWRAEAREFGWVPAVLGTSERGARAYAATGGMRVLRLGDEAVLDPARFDLRRASLSPVRHAVKRATRAGVTVQVRRQRDLPPDELAEVVTRIDDWRRGETERGFSMALGRQGDPSDGDVLLVTAHLATQAGPALVGVLGLVPWGRRGVSLDVMRRSPEAPNGVTELMVSELLDAASLLGLRRVSLNFCMFRAVFEDAERLGSGSLTRVGASVLGRLDRFWQLERLYRSNEKFEPTWEPRFLCYDDAVSLPQVAVAAGAVEGFVPWPGPRGAGGALDADHLAELDTIHAETRTQDPTAVGPRRTGTGPRPSTACARSGWTPTRSRPQPSPRRPSVPSRAACGSGRPGSRWWAGCVACATTAASSSSASSRAATSSRCSSTSRPSADGASTSSRPSSTWATSCASTG